MILLPVLRYIVGRVLFVALVLGAINIYAPVMACAPNGGRSLIQTIEMGNKRISEVFQTVTRALP